MPAPVNTPEQREQAKRYESCFKAFGRGLARYAGGQVIKEGPVEVVAGPTQNVFYTHFPRPCAINDVQERFETTLRVASRMPTGLGLIVGPSLHQPSWARHLKRHHIRCGFWVPFLHRDLSRPIPRTHPPGKIHITPLENFSVFLEHPHPYIGKLTTAQRKAEVEYAEDLVHKDKAVQLIAWEGDVPVGGATVFFHRTSSAPFNVGVLESHRQRGIGNALMLEALRVAQTREADCMVLSAATKAIPVYERVGFTSAGHYGSYYIGRDRLTRIVQRL